MKNIELPAGPTLNPSYNDLLVRWAASGHSSNPECEECGCDLTGKNVFDTGINWLCGLCKEEESFSSATPSYREDFEAGGYRAVR